MSDPAGATADIETHPIGTLMGHQIISQDVEDDAANWPQVVTSVVTSVIHSLATQALDAGGTVHWDSLSVKTVRAMINETDNAGNVIIPAGTLAILVRIQAVMPVGWIAPEPGEYPR